MNSKEHQVSKVNYQVILDKTIKEDSQLNSDKRLLLHACCAPCSSYCIEYLSGIYNIVIYFFNPNITDKEEYEKRADEIKRFVNEFNGQYCGKASRYFEGRTCKEVSVIFGEYRPQDFFEIARGLEKEKEGGARCYKCYEQRLRSTVQAAKEGGYDYFSTTLSISPYKRANWLNEIGDRLSGEMGVPYLFSDFKKKNGYRRSIELSTQYGLYRQDFCGCIYSKVESELKREAVNTIDYSCRK